MFLIRGEEEEEEEEEEEIARNSESFKYSRPLIFPRLVFRQMASGVFRSRGDRWWFERRTEAEADGRTDGLTDRRSRGFPDPRGSRAVT